MIFTLSLPIFLINAFQEEYYDQLINLKLNIEKSEIAPLGPRPLLLSESTWRLHLCSPHGTKAGKVGFQSFENLTRKVSRVFKHLVAASGKAVVKTSISSVFRDFVELGNMSPGKNILKSNDDGYKVLLLEPRCMRLRKRQIYVILYININNLVKPVVFSSRHVKHDGQGNVFVRHNLWNKIIIDLIEIHSISSALYDEFRVCALPPIYPRKKNTLKLLRGEG